MVWQISIGCLLFASLWASGFWICVHHLAKAPAAQTGGGFERAFGVSHHSSSCKKRKVILSLSVIC